MKKKNTKSKNQNQNDKGNEILIPPHLLLRSKVAVSSPDNSSTGEVQVVSVSSNAKKPCSDNHILCDVLSRLPVKSLMRFKAVCTHWKSPIERDSYLYGLHTARSKALLGGPKPLLFISSVEPEPEPEPNQVGGIIEFSTASPYRQPEVKKLALDRSEYGLPKQTVNGLVCITAGYEAFIIYNPSTGERSPWISTTKASQENQGKGRREVACIALGFSPATNEHKVVCISSIKRNPDSETYKNCCDYPDKEDIDGEDQVCEVMTIGENTRRRIDEIPPYSLGNKEVYSGGGPDNCDSSSVYVNGSIYWRFRYTRKGEVVMGFDLEKEKFRVIPIPDYVIHPLERKYSQTVELMEIDGHVVVFKWIRENDSSVLVIDEDGDSIQWTEEKLLMPCGWNAKPNLTIVALPGTNLIIQKSQYSDTIYYCCRKTSVLRENKISYEHHSRLEQITYLDENLAPVYTRRCCMF